MKNKPFYKGADVSSLGITERNGGSFKDQGVTKDLFAILKDHGFNLIRLRLFNDPYDSNGNSYGGGDTDFRNLVKLAQRAVKEGFCWLLDFHYSDFWADPGKQFIPKAWAADSPEKLPEKVYEYTCQILEKLKEMDLLPDMVAVGNEVTNGLLWPYGRVPAFDHIAALINAGIRAVREKAPQAQVMIHLDNGGNNELYRNWFDSYLAAGGMDFDLIGLSYYPFWHGTLAQLKDNMNDLAERYGKDMIVVETSFAFTLRDYQEYEKLPSEKRKGMATRKELTENLEYPCTEEGQSDFLSDLIDLIRSVDQKRGIGFVYWEPACLPVPGSDWATEAGIEYTHEKGPGGNEWANQALFDYDGNSLMGLKTIKEK